MPTAYSALGSMSEKPYAIGERPGGNYIPTIPLLSGKDAWDSLSQYYDKRFSMPYDTASEGPRHLQDVLNKASAFEKLSFGYGGGGMSAYNARTYSGVKPKQWEYNASQPEPQVGVSYGNRMDKMRPAELDKYRNRFNAQGDPNWGENWRERYMQFRQQNPNQAYNPHAAKALSHTQPHTQRYESWKQQNNAYAKQIPDLFNPRLGSPPDMQGSPEENQFRLEVDHFMGKPIPPTFQLPEGTGWTVAEPAERARLQQLSESSGLDVYTLMRGLQAEQQLAPLADNPQQMQAAMAKMPPQYRDALKAWQYTQKTQPNAYDPGKDNPLWSVQLRDDVKTKLPGDPSRYMGSLSDWEGLEGLAERFGVDPRDKIFQNYWNDISKQVAEQGWGTGDLPQNPGDLFRRYATWKRGQMGLLDSYSSANDPTAKMQRIMGHRRTIDGQEYMTPSLASQKGPGVLGTIGGGLSTLGAGITSPLPVATDLVRALRGNDNFDFTKMHARNFAEGANNMLGTDFGHDTETDVPLLGKGKGRSMFARPLSHTSSAAPRWAAEQGLDSGEGYLRQLSDKAHELSNDPDMGYLGRVNNQGLSHMLRWGEVPLELLAGSKLMGSSGNWMQAKNKLPGLGRVLSNTAPTLGKGYDLSKFMAQPHWQYGLSALEQLPTGTGQRVRDIQQGAAQGIRNWANYGQEPNALKQLAGETGASLVEAGPLVLGSFVHGASKPAATAWKRLAGGAAQAGKNPFLGAGLLTNTGRPVYAQLMQGPEAKDNLLQHQMGMTLPTSTTFTPEGTPIYDPEGWKRPFSGEETWQERVRQHEAQQQNRLQGPQQKDPAILQEQIQETAQPGLEPDQIAKKTPESDPSLFGLDGQVMSQVGPEGALAATGAMKKVLETVDKTQPAVVQRVRQEIASKKPDAPTNVSGVRKLQEQLGVQWEEAGQVWDQMDDASKFMVIAGVTIGTLSMLHAMTNDDAGLGTFLTSVLGFGAAAGILSNAGMFGNEAQTFTKSLLDMTSLTSQDNETKRMQDQKILAGLSQNHAGATPAALSLGKAVQDNRIDPQEMEQLWSNPQTRDYMFSLGNRELTAIMRAAAAGDPEVAKKLQQLKSSDKYLDQIVKALAKPEGTGTELQLDSSDGLLKEIGSWFSDEHKKPVNIPGMGLTPEQAKRYVDLARKT